MVKDTDRTLPFLDILVCSQDNGHLEIYCKDTHSEWKVAPPSAAIKTVVQSLADEELREKKLEHIRRVFQANGCSAKVV